MKAVFAVVLTLMTLGVAGAGGGEGAGPRLDP